MRESGYCPAGAEFDSLAPWNEEEPNKVELDVDLNVIVANSIKITVSDGYTINDINIAVEEYLNGTSLTDDKNSEWHIDDFEVLDYNEL